MNLETLLIVVAVVLAAVFIFNVILPWIRKQQEDGRAGNDEPEELREAPTAALAPAPSASPAPVPEFGTRRNAPTRSPAPMAPMAPASARPARRSPVGSLAGMRDGIVLAAVLGPCRAHTPFV